MQQNIADKLLSTLINQFHLTTFRPGQLEALITLMTEGRLLCIQPTGHGKSLLYQLPSVLLEGITLVISPLLALMRDQLKQLTQRFKIPAASISSDQTLEENMAARDAAARCQIRILFIAPEQLEILPQMEFILNLPLKLLVVDEAHCISTWGHDFRPSYRQITQLIHAFIQKNADIKLLALTATANKKTEKDIKQQLEIGKKKLIVHRASMERRNIRLSIVHTKGIAAKLATLTELLTHLPGSGLIYCATRENTELVAEYLKGQGIKASAYHAGIESSQKLSIQNDFIQDIYPVIAATNALGMGIDKSNLRFIIHFDFPGSITAYYQEVGRAGRDGNFSEGILLYDRNDSKIQRYFIESALPTREDFETVLFALSREKEGSNLNILKRNSGLHPTKLTVVLAELIEQGFILKNNIKGLQIYQKTSKKGFPNLTRFQTQHQIKLKELTAIQHYAEQSHQCLMEIVRQALGDIKTSACGQCSHCITSTHAESKDKDLIMAISFWLERRTIPIILNKKIKNLSTGLAILDGKNRSADFVQFMVSRAKKNVETLGLTEKLTQLIKECLIELNKHHALNILIPLPSRTWHARDAITQWIGAFLNIPVLSHILSWEKIPPARQGELQNNDQRQHNVNQRMCLAKNQSLPNGTILLMDDYIGSGATLNEAARTLREYSHQNKIVPFTIASVKWRLGKTGMI